MINLTNEQRQNALATIRQAMQAQNIDTYILTKMDPHQSEYAADFYNEVQFISGFKGSVGTVIITQDHAGLWTDGRYFLQAEAQLMPWFTLHKMREKDVLDPIPWSLKHTAEGGSIAINPLAFSAAEVKVLSGKAKQSKLSIKNADLVSPVWDNRPVVTRGPLFNYDVNLSGKTYAEKLGDVSARMFDAGAGLYVISSLDDIAWLLNMRSTVDNNSFNFSAYVTIAPGETCLFIDTTHVDDEVVSALSKQGIKIKPYGAITDYIKAHPSPNVAYAPKRTSWFIHTAMSGKQPIEIPHDYTAMLKAIKNKVERQGTRVANEKDAAAFIKLIKWVKQTVPKQPITETDVEDKLRDIRTQLPDYLGTSFAPIVGYAGNGAIIHYKAEKETAKTLEPIGLVLIDSGANFIQGTTDITRTVVLGELTNEMKMAYTAVLRGNIALTMAKFPEGTMGYHLDTIARAQVWLAGFNYGHGTGHGIGHMLNVHEGPQSVSPVPLANGVPLQAKMLISNEPGVYVADQFGVRLETSLFVREVEKTTQAQFLGFENVTFVPFEREAIIESMLTPAERNWLNIYHQKVYLQQSSLDYLTTEEKEWLKEATKPI